MLSIAIGTVRDSLEHLGYVGDLIQTNWTSRDIFKTEPAAALPLMAFWDRPFDQFRSALAVAERNGMPAEEYATQIASRTVSHVLLCDDESAELWFLDRHKIVLKERVSANRISALMQDHGQELERGNVAVQKIHLRQYALYETDPNNLSFGEWAVRPTIEQASKVFTGLVRKVSRIVDEHPLTIDQARWVFRLLTLRVGKDRGWAIASDLEREAVSGFADRAESYPERWPQAYNSVSESIRLKVSECVLETLQPLDFSSVDPIWVIKAFGIPALRPLRAGIDLFPTPRPYAWDMVASIPLHPDMGVFDPTVGTGTFLVAAGHALWSRSASSDSALPRLREALHGADHSSFAVDLAHISLDLAFGWDESGWRIKEEPTDAAVSKLSEDQEWALVGNPPWSAAGRSENEAGRILSAYVDALAGRKTGWIATIVPRSVWTNRSSHGRSLRERVASSFQVESVCELPWGAIHGGRAQAIASVISRGQPASPTVWKRLDGNGVVHTIGYNLPHDSVANSFLSPDSRYLGQRLVRRRTLGDSYNVRVGLQPRRRDKDRIGSYEGGDLPYIDSLGEMTRDNARPRALLDPDMVRDDDWVRQHFQRRATKYRAELGLLPQLAIPQNIYEGSSRLSVSVFDNALLLANRFLICTPRRPTTMDFARGVATMLTSSIGRLWLHLFATAGRHLAKTELERFPLPSCDTLKMIGTTNRLVRRRIINTPWIHEVAMSDMPMQVELEICRAYGLDDRECGVILALGYILSFNNALPRDLLQRFEPDNNELEQMFRKLEIIDPETSADDYNRLYVQVLAVREQERYLVLDGEGYHLSIENEAVFEENL